VSNIEEGWASGWAGVDDGEDSLQVAVEIGCGGCLTGELEEIVSGVPPGVSDSGRKDSGLSGGYDGLLFCDLRSESSSYHSSFFKLIKVDVKGGTAGSGWQPAVELENYLAVRVSLALHVEDLSGVAVFYLQEGFHGLSLRYM
jgi:hypothetical protein